MSYGRFRTGCNSIDVEGREIAKIEALEDVARSLTEILIILKQLVNHEVTK